MKYKRIAECGVLESKSGIAQIMGISSHIWFFEIHYNNIEFI